MAEEPDTGDFVSEDAEAYLEYLWTFALDEDGLPPYPTCPR